MLFRSYRVHLTANYPPMAVPLKLDITTCDKITPREITYNFKLLLEDRSITVLAYNLETVIAEKIETIISRGDQNTRPRDYYDVYILLKLQHSNLNSKSLKQALAATSRKRGSYDVIVNYKNIMESVKESKDMQEQWSGYQRNFEYASDIKFEDACDVVVQIMDEIEM